MDERPSSLFPNSTTAQCLIIDDVKLLLKMKGPLIFLAIRRPSIAEVTNHNLQRFIMTNPHDWDPYGTDLIPTNNFSNMQRLVCHVSSYLSTFLFNVMIFKSSKVRSITPEDLVCRWVIGITTSRLTLQSTYQEHTVLRTT